MELILNLTWAGLAALMVLLWLRFGPRAGVSRRTQLVALALLLVVLFPVISVSDDLQALYNPAEVDSSVRRDHVFASAHSILPPILALIQPVAAELSMGAPRFAVLRDIPLPAAHRPCLAAIDNRPPPAA
ncbi:MAG: hypothetical protein WBF26_03845 [Candidatus Sulfotelmatobacter sp.]